MKFSFFMYILALLARTLDIVDKNCLGNEMCLTCREKKLAFGSCKE